MSDSEKVKYYNLQFPPITGSLTFAITSDKTAIAYVNELILQEKCAYELRVRRREEKASKEKERVERQKQKEEAEAKRKAETHVAAMKKKYGLNWAYKLTREEDCPEAEEERDEDDRISVMFFAKREQEEKKWFEEREAQMERDEHEEKSFKTRMTIETRGMTDHQKFTHIQKKWREFLDKKWDREDEFESEYQEEANRFAMGF
jgi:hypothetical protein